VTCRDVESLIIPYARGAAIPPEAAAHIAGCPSCSRLVRAMANSDPLPAPTPEQLRRIEAGMLAGLKPVKPLAPTGALTGAFMLVSLLAAAIGVFELGVAGWHALNVWQATAVFAALAASSIVLALTLARQMAPGSRVLLPASGIVFGFPAIIGAIFVTLFQPHPEAGFIPTGLMCLRIGLECAVPVGVLSWLILRRGAILNPLAAGALAGALAGLTGLLLLEIFCPNLNAYHVLAWHLGAAVASTLGGAAIGFVVEHLRE
jgi:hypothetical protein